RRTIFNQPIKEVLEQHFHKRKWPTAEEITFLADVLQLDKKVLRVWFSNRRQREKR
ncbi:hypothetical protein DAPPUDRAFT_41869, partial [Daphnia pulex]